MRVKRQTGVLFQHPAEVHCEMEKENLKRSQEAWFLVPTLPYTSIVTEPNIAKLITSFLFHRVLVPDVFYNRP